MDWSSFGWWPPLIGNSTCLLVPITPIICGDVSTGTQSLFGEFSPILDMAILVSATAFRETGYLEFCFKTNHHYRLFVTGKGKKGMGAYDTSHLHLIMPPLSLTQTHTQRTPFIF